MINITDTSIIKINDLHKCYDGIHAVNGVSIEIKRGEIFGFIGPDGAGKSTIFKILAGVLNPSSGNAKILGINPRDARLKTGYLTQQFSFYSDLTVNENLKYSAGLRNVPDNIFKERSNKFLHLMGLEGFTSRLAGQLSGGMKQKLALCCVLIFEPEILLLDEPTTGVDPISRREFWDILTTLALENVTIVIATPYLDEAERCNRIALIYDGKFQQVGTPEQLKKNLGLQRLVIRTNNIGESEKIISEEISANNSVIADIQTFGDRLDVLVKDIDAAKNQINKLLNSNNIPPKEILQEDVTLENVFVAELRQKGLALESVPFPYNKLQPLTKEENIETKIAIKTHNLSKNFGSFQAVKNLNLEVHYGRIYGLLGANGAGKTTTIKMLCGLLSASSGEISIAGEKSNLRSENLRKQIGYMSQKFTLYNDLTIFENLRFYCGVYGVPLDQQKQKIDWVLIISGLKGQENLITGELPGGWKQRVAFGASVLHEPEILFLDEPTSGVDPLARRQFWKLIEDFARHGTAIIVTTHYLEEAEHCNKIGFMSSGEIVAQGSPDKIKASQPGKLFEITVDAPQKANILLKRKLESWRATLFGTKLHIILDNPEKDLPQIESMFNSENIKIIHISQIPYTLEDAFIGIIERSKAGSA